MKNWLELGMTESLINRLSTLRQIKVRSLSAVRKYHDVGTDPVAAGRELAVDEVVEGNIQKEGDKLRVTVRLVNVADGTSQWAEKFDEKFTEIFSVQDSISEQVAAVLVVKLTNEEKRRLSKQYTENAEAYQLYLKGYYFWNKL